MTRILFGSKRRVAFVVASLAIICALAARPLLSSAHVTAAPSVTVTNNSSRDISHIYLSAPGSDAWGPDQLNSAVLTNGSSVTLSGFSCSAGQVKVIAEDNDGCFLSAVFNCAEDAVWNITNNTAADCGD